MKNTLSLHQTTHRTASRRSLIHTSILWTLQILLALIFLFAGSMKLVTPLQELLAQMPVALPGLFIRFIGVAECAGALGLILPGLFRIQRRLTPLAAWGLTLIMIGATLLSLISISFNAALLPLVVGLLCVIVATARRHWR